MRRIKTKAGTVFGIFVAFQAGSPPAPGMTSLSLAAVSSDNPFPAMNTFGWRALLVDSGLGDSATEAHPAAFINTTGSNRFSNPGHRPCTVRKSALLVVSVAGDIHLVRYDFDRVDSGKIRLPGEGQDIAIKIAILFCLQPKALAEEKGSRETASNAALRRMLS